MKFCCNCLFFIVGLYLVTSTPILASSVAAAEELAHGRALWVRSTQAIVKDSRKRKSLLKYCQDQRVNTIWLQLLYETRQMPLDRDQAVCEVRYPREIRRLLREAHQASISVHALEGYPEFALREFHGVPEAIVEAVIEFNEESEAEEKFDGIHFENAPYLLVGWQSQQMRQQILNDYLTITRKCKQISDTESKFKLGIDIPVSWMETDSGDQQRSSEFSFDGQQATLTMHCLHHVDSLCVMSDVDSADEISKASTLLLNDAATTTASIWIGLQTEVPATKRVWFALGLPHKEFETACLRKGNPLAWRSRFNGFPLSVYDDGQYVHVGLEVPEGQAFTTPDFLEALQAIVKFHGADNETNSRTADEFDTISAAAMAAIDKEPRFYAPRKLALDIEGYDTKQPGIFVKVSLPLAATFGDSDSQQLDDAVTAIAAQLEKPATFSGIAIHTFESASRLERSKKK